MSNVFHQQSVPSRSQQTAVSTEFPVEKDSMEDTCDLKNNTIIKPKTITVLLMRISHINN